MIKRLNSCFFIAIFFCIGTQGYGADGGGDELIEGDHAPRPTLERKRGRDNIAGGELEKKEAYAQYELGKKYLLIRIIVRLYHLSCIFGKNIRG
jgi:hypothetical protein